MANNSGASLAWAWLSEEDKEIPVRYDHFVMRLFKAGTEFEMKSHAALGLAGEVGEIVDVIKREIVYGKTTDGEGKSTVEGLIEELGDIKFFCQAIQNLYGITDIQVTAANVKKLSKRYKDLTYSDSAALGRADKDAENS